MGWPLRAVKGHLAVLFLSEQEIVDAMNWTVCGLLML